ncbi:hypothetical protein F4778DRAFT_788335 [Xylariomycetidae sp. FL2044]|nr:hypothetical protein F4778DRAFT_788335 [Xylariomycetidae sp. FL2044]
MAILNQALVDGAHVVARAVGNHIRQELTSSAVGPSTTPGPSLASTTSLPPSSTAISSAPMPTNTTNNNNDNGGGGGGGGTGTSSPLLFFVALGFGVVFTNLWIIVGVKYCFRYNARNRQMRGLDENGEPINLENMPTRPHRRRREKKLMTMDEVNEKFPMMKYKTWVSDRAREGLPTAGGVSAPASRANSVRSVEGIVPEIASKETQTNAVRNNNNSDTDAEAANKKSTEDGTPGNNTNQGTTLAQAPTATSIITKDPERRASEDDEDEDEQINAALPPELLGTAGDTCAICIDTLEDDDDVRGLTCGHAFHAVCLDPWLTNRRACCPLCKADYYTPKPRPPPADGDPNNPNSPTGDPSRNNGRLNMPRSPQRTFTSWSSFRGAPRMIVPARFAGNVSGGDQGNYRRQNRLWERQRPRGPRRRTTATQNQQNATRDHTNNNNSTTITDADDTWISRFRGRFSPFRLNQVMRRNNHQDPQQAETPTTATATQAPEVTASGANGTGATPTPSQLEAGIRPSTGTGPGTGS